MNRSTASPRRIRGLSNPAATVVDVMRGTFPVGRTRRKPCGRDTRQNMQSGSEARQSKLPGPAVCALLDDWLCLEEALHVVLHEQYGDVQVVGVARLRVDLDLLAEYGLLSRNVDTRAAEHLVVDALAGAVGLRDRREDYLHSRHAVERVVAGRILAVLRLVRGDQLRSRAT